MYIYERERLNRYIADAEKWLVTIQKILEYPESPAQAAALSMTRAAAELVTGIQQQMTLDEKVQCNAEII